MFTGLVEVTGRVVGLEDGGMSRLRISAGDVSRGVGAGDSVSVNGVCLTVNETEAQDLVFYAMPETLRRTALGGLTEGSLVNLERAMGVESRFGGHIVQGHVDGVGRVLEVEEEGGAELWKFTAPPSVLRYTVEKGSICVDGISLTVVEVDDSSFTVSILPQTRAATNLQTSEIGDAVNLEADVIGKYVERLLGPRISSNENFERSMEDAV
ncbi:MAG: riboflavin synthase [Rubrobacteraceae bacterium]